MRVEDSAPLLGGPLQPVAPGAWTELRGGGLRARRLFVGIRGVPEGAAWPALSPEAPSWLPGVLEPADALSAVSLAGLRVLGAPAR